MKNQNLHNSIDNPETQILGDKNWKLKSGILISIAVFTIFFRDGSLLGIDIFLPSLVLISICYMIYFLLLKKDYSYLTFFTAAMLLFLIAVNRYYF